MGTSMYRKNQQGHAGGMSAPVVVLKVLRLVRAGGPAAG
jgi:hypothetical protein